MNSDDITPNESIPKTQLEWLLWDLGEFQRAFDTHTEVLNPLANFTDPDLQRRQLVVADLFFRILSLVNGLYSVVYEGLRTSSQVLSRALYESIGNFWYLVNHPQFQHEALVWLAFSSFRMMQHFPDDHELADEHQQLLAKMNSKAVAEARKRINRKPFTWSGKGFMKMASESQLKGYAMYALLSDDVHSGIVGEHARLLATDSARIVHLQIGQDLSSGTSFH